MTNDCDSLTESSPRPYQRHDRRTYLLPSRRITPLSGGSVDVQRSNQCQYSSIEKLCEGNVRKIPETKTEQEKEEEICFDASASDSHFRSKRRNQHWSQSQ